MNLENSVVDAIMVSKKPMMTVANVLMSMNWMTVKNVEMLMNVPEKVTVMVVTPILNSVHPELP